MDLSEHRDESAGLLLRNLAVIAGAEMELIPRGFIQIERGRISEMGEGDGGSAAIQINCDGLAAIPGFVDAHIHVGDSVAKEAGVGLPIADVVSPTRGLKHQILRSTSETELADGMRGTLKDMIRSGVTTFADFREGGPRGVELLLEAAKCLPIRPVILGRLAQNPFTSDELTANTARLPDRAVEEVNAVLQVADGISTSTVNDLTDPALEQICDVARRAGKLRAVHVSEAKETVEKSQRRTGLTDVQRVVKYFSPSFVVHMTNAPGDDIGLVSRSRIPVVVCPRANSILAVGLPPMTELSNGGVTVALGTDNVMLNPPDMFREMDYVARMIRAVRREPTRPTPSDILKMATINGAKALGMDKDIGSIDLGKAADIVVLDRRDLNLRHSRDLVASIVLRAGVHNIRAVLVEGRLAYRRPSDISRDRVHLNGDALSRAQCEPSRRTG